MGFGGFDSVVLKPDLTAFKPLTECLGLVYALGKSAADEFFQPINQLSHDDLR
ncbi:hypothetical protein ES703_04636 [subsurface metagenome]